MIEIDVIVDCCNHILEKLIILYENSEIDELVFKENSNIKIQFITNNINRISDIKIKDTSLRLVNYINSIRV